MSQTLRHGGTGRPERPSVRRVWRRCWIELLPAGGYFNKTYCTCMHCMYVYTYIIVYIYIYIGKSE